MTLDDLSPGHQGIVTGFTSDDPPPRILEMGLLPGTTVTVVRLAPMGDPIDLKVRGYHLSIRRQEARQIEVDPT